MTPLKIHLVLVSYLVKSNRCCNCLMKPKTWVAENYLKPCKLTIKETKFAFHARTRMVRVKKNYWQNQNCLLCKGDVEDSQPHLLDCEMLVPKNTIVDEMPKYEDLFSEKMKKQINLIQILHTNFLKRTKMLQDKED